MLSFVSFLFRESWVCGIGGLVRAIRVWSGNMEAVLVLSKRSQPNRATSTLQLLGSTGLLLKILPIETITIAIHRFLRVWEHGRGGKLAKHKIYLKSRLNCVLLTR